MPIFRCKVCLLALLVLFCALQTGAQPWSPRPDAVAGQINLVHVEANFVDARGFFGARNVAIDTSVVPNRVYVFDVMNNRVLGWRNAAALTNGAPADLVLGQPDFFSVDCGRSRQAICTRDFSSPPVGLAVDANGNVYVADAGNFRILEFDSPFTSDTLADRVFGASDFTAFGCALDSNDQFPPNTRCPATGLALDRAGNLYVSDGNDAVDGAAGVYVYRQPLTTDTVADVHIGHTQCDPPLDASSFCGPQGLALDAADNLYVTDSALDRVLVFHSPLTTDGVADLVLGQPDFTTRGFGCNPIGPAPLPLDLFCFPSSVVADAAGHLWVADRFHNRILGYDSPLTTDAVPDRVLGKRGSLTSGASSCSGNRPARGFFCAPQGLALDSQGALWVAESQYHRVTRISTPLAAGAVPDLVLGQVDFVHGTENLVDGRGFSAPMTAAVDRASSPPHLYVLDSMNHRVLGWRDAEDLAAGLPADLVLGQPDLFSNLCNQGGVSARSLCFLDLETGGLAVDGAGNLYVSDTGNNRILEFDSPFTTDTVADRVFGQQGSFTTGQRNKGGVSAGSLYLPMGLAVDRQGNLYAADSNNYRVLRYDQPLRHDTVADRVYGKQGRFDLGVRPASSTCRGGP